MKVDGGKAADASIYNQVVGSLMYLLATRSGMEFFSMLRCKIYEEDYGDARSYN